MKRISSCLLFLIMLAVLFPGCKNKPGNTEVFNQITKVAKLATVEYTFSKHLVIDKEKKILRIIPLNSAVLIAETEAVLKVGIDLNKINPDSIKIADKNIRLTLPPIEVINFSYPAEKFNILKEYSNITEFRKGLKIEDIDKFYRESENNLRDNINSLNIRETARQKTAFLIDKILRNMGFENINIRFQELDEPLLYVKPS